jgi:hypothetical protein
MMEVATDMEFYTTNFGITTRADRTPALMNPHAFASEKDALLKLRNAHLFAMIGSFISTHDSLGNR